MLLKKTLIVIFVLFSICAWSQTSDAPAFPGAEGHGRYTTGGRASDGSTHVYHVTNLNDSGEGSLRWALKQTGPRTIVFDVGGYIDLKSQLEISSNTTIAGQTAPAPGITLRYYTVYFSKCSNVIVRFIRFRRSQVKDVDDGADATWGRQQKNIILDHCSFSWSIDEVASFYDNRNFTMQWCTIGEGLNNAGHGKGAHGYGGIWGGKEASFHHNMLIHNNNRSPRLNGARYNWDGYDKTKYKNSVDAERDDFRNCVNYNWGQGNGAYAGMGGYHNIVNNYYKAGPGTKNTTRIFQCGTNASKDSDGALPDGLPGRYYISGNYVTAAGDNAANYDWKGVIHDSGTGVTIKSDGQGGNVGGTIYNDTKHLYGLDDYVAIKLTIESDKGVVTTHSAETAYIKVLNYVGASLYRDAVDARYVEEARTGTAVYTGTVTNVAGIIDLIQDPDSEINEALVAFPDLESTSRASSFDTDLDGMPDTWETEHGLNPNDATDKDLYTIDTDKKWYSNLEVYLNSLVEDIMKAGNADAIETVNEYYPGTELVGEVSIPTDFVDFYTMASQNPTLVANFSTIETTIEYDGEEHKLTPQVLSITDATKSYTYDGEYQVTYSYTRNGTETIDFTSVGSIEVTTTITLSEDSPSFANSSSSTSNTQSYVIVGSTPVNDVSVASSVVKFEYFTLEGRRINEPQIGLNIRRTTYTNGETISEIIIKK